MTEEKTIWTETASMKDFYVTPKLWLFSLLSLGIYTLVIYFIRLYTRYTLTNQRLIVESGLLVKRIEEIELFRIKDTKFNQGFFQRLVDMGDIAVFSSDQTGNFVLQHMPNAREKREQIRAMANQSREENGIRTIINDWHAF